MDFLKRKLLPIALALGSYAIDPTMSAAHLISTGLILLAGVVLPSPWEATIINILRDVVKRHDDAKASAAPPMPLQAPPPTEAIKELDAAMERARRVSLLPPLNGTKP